MRVFPTSRGVSKMSLLTKSPNISLLELDPIIVASMLRAFESVEEMWVISDFFFNKAGQTVLMHSLHFDNDTAKSMYEINVRGILRLTQVLAT